MEHDVKIWPFDPKEDDPLITMVRGVEADVHAHGWDGHARLGLVLRHQLEVDGLDPADSAGFAVCEIPMFPEFYEDPIEGLGVWNGYLATDHRAIEHLWNMIAPSADNFYGWLFISEMWMASVDAPATDELPDSLADLPEDQRQEGRIVLLMTAEGRIVTGIRRRAKEGLDKIEVMDNFSDEILHGVGGRGIINLDILMAVTKRLISDSKSFFTKSEEGES